MEFERCAVCNRTVLRGERPSEYVNSDGEPVVVCSLCKSSAEAAGWVPAGFASAAPPAPARRRRGAGATALRERLVRAANAARAAGAGATADRGEPLEPEPDPEPRSALDVFNSSPEVRKVAGLMRSLGEPRVCIRAESGGVEVITVAWDLSWYRWRVRGTTVKEVAKGNEISELRVEDRDWNASADEEGRLRRG